MRSLLLFGVCSTFCLGLNAQTDSLKSIEIAPVFVTETKPGFETATRQISSLTNSEMKERGAQTLADALATLPGVSQLTTAAISRPVIRGLSGNRLQVNLGGIRLEDQQWEDEFGLGFSDAGVERIELIKGPAGVLYGSDAMGGVIRIVEPDARACTTTRQDLNLKLFSNTRGAGLDYGLKKAGTNTFMLRGSAESHGDYYDGDGARVPNSRFALYNLKTGYVLHRSNWTSENRLHLSYNQFGFITDSTELHEEEGESRLSREFEEDHHNVFFGVLSSKNTLTIDDHTTLNATLGLQTNHRQEQERDEEAELDLTLHSLTLNANLQGQLPGQWHWTNNLAALFQRNANHGSRILVPDAGIQEASLFIYIHKTYRIGEVNGNLEAGVRFDRRQVTTRETQPLNPPSAEIPPFNRTFNEWNGALGHSWLIGKLTLRLDIGTGFRAGNLAELAANGLHEGSQNWNIGNPDMKTEKCLNMETSVQWQFHKLHLRAAAYRNRFANYIYLAPVPETRDGYPVFRYLQDDATLKGFESGASLESTGHYSFSADYSFLDARRDNGEWLPFIPANRLVLQGKYILPVFKSPNQKWREAFLSLGANIASAQHHPAALEFPTDAYWLLDAGAGVTIRKIRLLLRCRNLLDQAYTDHLSRLRYLGALDMGRNVVLNLGWQF